MSVFLTLPPQLLEKIEAILQADISEGFGDKIRQGLLKARRDIQQHDEESPSQANLVLLKQPKDPEADHPPSVTGADKKKGSISGDEASDCAPAVVPPPPPPTIDEDILVDLSRWASSDIGSIVLERKGLGQFPAYRLLPIPAGTC
jgi:hypothetical protein